MSRTAWVLAALVLSAALGTPLAAQEKAAERSWLSWLNPLALWSRPEPPPPAPPEAEDKKPRLLEAAAALRAREKADLLRRLDVCDRLLNIALETGDMGLYDRAKQLDTRAWSVFRERISSQAPSPGMSPSGDWPKEEP